MLRFEEAYELALSHVKTLSCFNVDLLDSLGYTLAEDVISDINMPPFDKSSMDGYACKMSDIQNELEVIEVIAAGDVSQKIILTNQCAKIMTGAKVPVGADCVLMVEDIEEISANKIRYLKAKTPINISFCEEDIKKDAVVLPKGIKIKPQHIAIMASVGCIQPMVYKKPVVTVIATGSELVEPDSIPGPTQIRNSNAFQIISQLERANATANYLGIAGDSEKETDDIIKRALAESDLILITGGVSMGDFDFVPKVLKANGFHLHFESILMKPGKPTVFGTHENCAVFGFPGNPVAAFVVFEIIVKDFMNKMMGCLEKSKPITLSLGTNFKRSKADRLGWIPSIINNAGEVIPVEYHGSAHLHSICNADVIFPIQAGISEIHKGEKVHVRQI